MRRVLVVDGEPHIRAVLRGYLEADGFAVSGAADGAQAVRQARRDAPGKPASGPGSGPARMIM